MLTQAGSPRQQRMGRHHRARVSWWRPQLSAVMKVSVAELVRRAQRERAHTSRARRLRVVPRQRCAPDAPATGRVTAGHQGSLCPGGEVKHG
ncbi:MAG: hypothetical protein ACRDRU_02225 [Pseudonocardiaceae bacterium]